MVVIRLARAGSKKKPFYHVVIAEKCMPRDGRFIERIGFYNPSAQGKAAQYRVNIERAQFWLSKGAQPSDTVRSIIKRAIKNGNPEDNVANSSSVAA